MYAVIETGGKQYRVEVGTELEVELLDAEPGSQIMLDRVLLVADGDEASIGRPIVGGAAVSATVLRRDRGEKTISFKYKPKARTRVKKGHRQEQTVLRIADIRLNGKSAAAEVEAAAATEQTERERLAEAATVKAAADAALAAKLAEKLAVPAEPAEEATAKPASPPAGRAAKADEAPADDAAADDAAAGEALADEKAAAEVDSAAAEGEGAAGADEPEVSARPKRARAPRKED